MSRMNQKLASQIILSVLVSAIAFLNQNVFANETYRVTMNTSKARSVAMGSAFTACRDDLPALDFNPAGYRIHAMPRNDIVVYLNPAGIISLAALDHSFKYGLTSLGLIVKGMGIRFRNIHLGLNLGEESLYDAGRLNRSALFRLEAYEFHQNIQMGCALVLAPKVSLGFSSEFFVRGGDLRHSKIGYRYGIRLKPGESITVGLCYVDWPNVYGTQRLPLERLGDETLNVGLNFSPFNRLLLALDLRNVSDQGKPAEIEPHLGCELQPFDFLYLRGGYYQAKNSSEKTVSVGAGIVPVIPLYSTGLFSALRMKCDLTYVKQNNVEWLFMGLFIHM